VNILWHRLVVSMASATLALSAIAADDPPAVTAGDPLGEAREQISAKQWPQAVAELKRVNQTRSADWNNLMGFALRKQTPPDLAGARKHYDAALRLDPKHKGALEYAGELDLMTGDLAAAEQRLQRLEAVCGTSCEEYADLKGAIERFKAAGNRYVPES
jgi:Flp pilus assembly protein TadD